MTEDSVSNRSTEGASLASAGEVLTLRLTDFLTEDALRVYLQGFYRETGLSVSLYAHPDSDSPIYNVADCHAFCRRMRDKENANGCLVRNLALARQALLYNDDDAVRELRTCPFGLIHGAEPIRHRGQIVAILYFGGVATNLRKAKQYDDDATTLYRSRAEIAQARRQFREYAKTLQNYYGTHVALAEYVPRDSLVTTYLGHHMQELGDSTISNRSLLFDNVLQAFMKWTESTLAVLCIYDARPQHGKDLEGVLVVRSVQMNAEIAPIIGDLSRLPEILSLDRSFAGQSIRENRLIYEETVEPDAFAWSKVIRPLNPPRAMAIPLSVGCAPLGTIVCFPGREIWPAERESFGHLAASIAARLRATISEDLYNQSRTFGENLGSVSREASLAFCMDVARNVRQTLNVAATSIFVIERGSGRLDLMGTTDESPKAQKLLGTGVYELGEGITGRVAGIRAKAPYGEIVYDLYKDPRRSPKFAELVPATSTGRHSMMLAQIPSPEGNVLGVIRCVDVIRGPESVFNTFNHFYLDALQFWARVLGAILALKEQMRMTNDFVLRFVHELGSGVMAVQNTVDLVRRYLSIGDKEQLDLKIDDAVSMAELLVTFLRDVSVGSRIGMDAGMLERTASAGWYPLESQFLMPMKNYWLQYAKSERKVGIRYSCPAVEVFVDKAYFTQVLSNLISNAIKYSFDPTGNQSDLHDVEINCTIGPFNRLMFEVSNWGIGVDDDQREFIFEQFRQGRNAGILAAGGLGLGLFIVRAIMEKHDGECVLRALRSPTTFEAWLPEFRVRRFERRRER